MTYPILQLCARATTHPSQAEMLLSATVGFTEWDELLYQAEAHGLAPLLYQHLNAIGAQMPDNFIRGLKLLWIRHNKANTIRMKALQEVISTLSEEGFDTLVLKGAALCNLVYSEIALRPMRDIDILVRPADAQVIQEILINCGYDASTKPIPLDHFHLAPLYRTIGGLTVCIEVHHHLYPSCPPYYEQKTFDQFNESAISFNLNGLSVRTLGLEDMLWHLYQHGFRAPFCYEPFRLISAADIISLVEKKLDSINWEKVRTDYPKLLVVLSLFHHLTPWRERVLCQLAIKPGRSPRGVGQAFEGWPRFRLSELRKKNPIEIFYRTFFPPEWWFKVYYGVSSRIDWYQYRFVTHQLHLLWWMRLYGAHFREFHLKAAGEVDTDSNGSLLFKIRRAKIVITAVLRQLNG